MFKIFYHKIIILYFKEYCNSSSKLVEILQVFLNESVISFRLCEKLQHELRNIFNCTIVLNRHYFLS